MKEDLSIVLSYIKGFFKKKRFVFRVIGFFFVLGAVNAFFAQKEYTSRTSFVAQVSGDEKLGTGLKNIAALIGVNFNEKSDAKDLPVYLYPKLLQSIEFQRELLNTPIYVKGRDSAVTLRYYYTNIRKPDLPTTLKKYTVGLPGLLINKLKPKQAAPVRIDSINYISKQELNIIDLLNTNLIFSIDETDGAIFLTVSLPERVAAAQIADRARELLQEKIIDYRIIKAKQEYDFITKQHEVKKEEFESAQAAFASYVDRNLFNSTQTSQIRKQRLETTYNLSSMVYSELETQKIRQGIKLQEDTPVFVTLQPAIVPLEPNNDPAILVIIKFLFIGFIVAVMFYLLLIVRDKFRVIWKTV